MPYRDENAETKRKQSANGEPGGEATNADQP